jgi:beta-lactamase regulating signal transducer with metallopeptidase domain
MPATLVDLLIRVVVLLALAWLCVVALGRRSASLRALIWTLALGSALALPILSRVVPSLEVRLLGEGSPPPDPAFAPVGQLPTDGVEVGMPTVQAPIGGVESPTPIRRELPPSESREIPWIWIGLGAWVSGVVLVLGRILVSHLMLSRITRGAVSPVPPDWEQLVFQVSRELGIRRLVGVRVSEAVQVPAMAGVFRPMLLLPIESIGWSAVERRDVGLHELAHVARWDGLAQLIGQICCAFYWFLPLAWFGASQAAALRERACDDVVLNAGTRASSYARNLLNLARVASGAELEPAALAMARPSRIEERVMGILDSKTRRERVTGKAAFAVLVFAGGIIGVVAAIEPVRRSAAITPSEEARWSESQEANTAGPVAGLRSMGVQLSGDQPAAARDTNLFCSRGVKSSQNSIHEDGSERRWTVKVEGTDCKVEMRVEGQVEFNDDFTDLKSISRGGYFTLDVTDGGTRRQLDIRPDGSSLARVYKLNGAEHAFDAEARVWFGEFLIALDRTTAVAIDIRLPRLLEKGGAGAVLNETALMPSDYARGRYYSGLLEKTRLTSAELTRLLDQAATLTESDYYASELLKDVGREGLDDPAERAAVLKLLRKMESDYYRAEVMKSVMDAGRPGTVEMNVMFEVVGSMESDYYQAEVLKQVLESGDLDADQRALVAKAASSMESGYYAAEILKNLAARGDLSADERSAFFDALSQVEDDYQQSEILGVLIREGTPTQAEIELILKASQDLDSDYYRSEILGQLLSGSTLRETDLLSVVTSLRNLESDYYKDEVLRKVLRNEGANDRVRQAVVEAAATMGNYHRDEVRRAARSI